MPPLGLGILAGLKALFKFGDLMDSVIGFVRKLCHKKKKKKIDEKNREDKNLVDDAWDSDSDDSS